MSWQHGGLPLGMTQAQTPPPQSSTLARIVQPQPNKRDSIVFRNDRISPLSSSSPSRSVVMSASGPSRAQLTMSSYSTSTPATFPSSSSLPTSPIISPTNSASFVPTRNGGSAEDYGQATSLSSSLSSSSSATLHPGWLGPSLLLLNIYCPDRDVGLRLRFTSSSTIDEALDQTVRRLFATLPPPLPSSSSSSSSPLSSSRSNGGHDTLASLEETMKKPWKFLCIRTGGSDCQPYLLYRDRTLASYQLQDEDELDLVLTEGPPRLVRVLVCDNQSTFTQRLEDETTVWEVVHKITRKIADVAEYPLDEYALFTADGRCLKEDERIAPYAPTLTTKLEFRRMALPAKDTHPIHLRFINACTPKPGTTQAETTELALAFNRGTGVKEALRRVIKLFPIKDRFSVAFYVPSSNSWLPTSATLDDFRFEENTVVQVRPLYKPYTLAVPFGKDRVKDVYKFRGQDTVRELYDLLLFNYPQVSEAKEKYTLCNRAGIDLVPNKPIWAYDSTFEVRIKLQPVAILIMGREEVIDVDFTAPVEKVIDTICRRFHVDEAQKDRLTLHSPSSPAALNPRASLGEQNVPPSCALLVKMAAGFTPPPLPPPQQQQHSSSNSGKAALLMSKKRSAENGTASKAEGGGSGGGGGDGITVGTVKISLEQLPSSLSIGKEDTGNYGENVNIWAEPEGPQYLNQEVGPEGETIVHAGTLNKLVVYLTSAATTDVRFMHAFLMTYLSFTNPRTLLNKLIERYHVPSSTHMPADVNRIQLRVCNVLKHWVSQHFDDFDHDLIQTVVNFVDDNLAVDGHDSVTTVLRNAIVKRTCGLKSRVTRGRKGTALTSNKSGAPPAKVDMRTDKWRRSARVGVELPPDVPASIFDFDEEEVARQLTLRESGIYRQIKSSELLNQSWNKEKLHHKAYNVLDMIQKFNETSLWVTSLILEPVKVKHRARRWESLIKIASHIHQLNNFNLLMAFVSGMNNSCILRLKWTKALLSRKAVETLERLERLMSPEGSYKDYREALTSVNPPCIPYIGVHLSDLVFIEDGNPDEVNGLINWDKRALVYKVIDLMRQYQNGGYNLNYVGVVATFLDDMSCPMEKELFEVSLQREPRGAQKNQIV